MLISRFLHAPKLIFVSEEKMQQLSYNIDRRPEKYPITAPLAEYLKVVL